MEAPGVDHSFQCQNVDQRLVELLQPKLLGVLAELISKPDDAEQVAAGKDAMKEFLFDKKRHEMAVKGCPKSAASENEPIFVVSDVISFLLDDCAKSKKPMGKKFIGVFTRQQSLDEEHALFRKALGQSNAWPQRDQVAFAKELIRMHDTDGIASCRTGGKTLADRSNHEVQCLFAPVSCNNSGCSVVTVRKHASLHDNFCPFKIIPCSRLCGVMLPRKDETDHMNTVCFNRPVSCPLLCLGCDASLIQGKLQEHCEKEYHTHILKLVATVQLQSEKIEWLKAQNEAIKTAHEQLRQSVLKIQKRI